MTAFIMVAVYLGLTCIISLINKNRQSSTRNTFVAKNGMPACTLIPLLFGELIAGAGTVGNASEAFTHGINAVWGNWGQAIGCIVFVVFASRFFYEAGRKGAMSVAEAFEMRFNNKVRWAVTMVVLLAFLVIYSMQSVAVVSIVGPIIRSVADINDITILIGCAVLFAVISLNGIKSVAGANVLHMAVIVVFLSVIAWANVRDAGGVENIYQQLLDTHFNLMYPDVSTVIAQVIGAAFAMISAMTVVNSCYCCRSLHEARKGIIVVAVLVTIFALLPAAIGLSGRILLPESNGKGILYEMANRLSPSWGGLASIAILGAVLSTGPAILLMLATTVVRDIYLNIKPKASEKKQMICFRASVVAIAVLSVFIASNMKSILNDLLASFQIRAISGIVLVISLHWDKVTNDAAFWSIVAGGVIAAIWHFAGSPFGIAPLWVSLGVGLTLLVVISLSSNKGKEEYQEYLRRFKSEATKE